MSSLDQRGHLDVLSSSFYGTDLYLYVCSYVWHIYSILLYCYVSTLTPLYVRPLNQQTINYQLYILSYDNRYVDGGVHASDGGRCHPSIRGDICSGCQHASVCVFLCETYLFYCIVLYCYVSTLAPLYVRPLIVYHPLSSSSSFAYRWASPPPPIVGLYLYPLLSLSIYIYVYMYVYITHLILYSIIYIPPL